MHFESVDLLAMITPVAYVIPKIFSLRMLYGKINVKIVSVIQKLYLAYIKSYIVEIGIDV